MLRLNVLSSNACAVLASAYELELWQVDADARFIDAWRGEDADLMRALDQRHAWSVDSEYSRHYLGDVREALGRAE